MTMLEKAARAAYDGRGFKPRDDMGSSLKFEQLAKFQQESWFNAARAVLLAVREPSIELGGNVFYYATSTETAFEQERKYTAMIDAIIEGK